MRCAAVLAVYFFTSWDWDKILEPGLVTVSVVFNFLVGTLPYLAICLETNGVTHCHLRTFFSRVRRQVRLQGREAGGHSLRWAEQPAMGPGGGRERRESCKSIFIFLLFVKCLISQSWLFPISVLFVTLFHFFLGGGFVEHKNSCLFCVSIFKTFPLLYFPQSANMTVIDAKISEVDRRFDLVLIMERMEESLVLLADMFCWPLQVKGEMRN